MLKTFLGKFTFFFWLSFFMINIPIHLFGISYIKDLLKSSEEEKISLMIHTLKPVIALNISFNQDKQLNDIFENILEHNSIDSIEVHPREGTNKHYNSHISDDVKEIFIFQTSVMDPFTEDIIATVKLRYINDNLEQLNNKILLIFFSMFLAATTIFFMFFMFFIRKDLEVLEIMSKKLSSYLYGEKYEPIILRHTSSEEISTIVDILNDVVKQNSQYVKDLEMFNTKLETKVTQKIAKLQKQEELMVHQSRQAAMGEMLESIAHQWRQPLNIIGLATTKLDLAYKFKKMDEQTFHEVIETVSYNINYMSNTIDDFRNFLHPQMEQTYFDPQTSFRELTKILGSQLNNNTIQYKVSVEGHVEIYGVENEFKQVALIMVNNSIDAIKSQMDEKLNKKFTISIMIFQLQDKAIIQVMDNGGGIKEDSIDSIFNAYFTTKFASQGTGIGLHIVKNIIESRMKGSISVKNTKDGCCFSITLPLKNQNKEISQ